MFTTIAKETNILAESQELNLSDKNYSGHLSLDNIHEGQISNKYITKIDTKDVQFDDHFWLTGI
jgi:hypothetical protein